MQSTIWVDWIYKCTVVVFLALIAYAQVVEIKEIRSSASQEQFGDQSNPMSVKIVNGSLDAVPISIENAGSTPVPVEVKNGDFDAVPVRHW